MIRAFRYRLNQKIRWILNSMSPALLTSSTESRFDIDQQVINRILLVRANFRMGNTVLAAPAIWAFRKRFPRAKIDFVGGAISKTLLENLCYDDHFVLTRRFPGSSWDYPLLIHRLRSRNYDLAMDLSCSQSALGAFIVGLSDARFRVGLRGNWDQWFNVRIPRPRQKNKYASMPALLATLGVDGADDVPRLALSAREELNARAKIEPFKRYPERPVVGVFVGGRKTWDKRWPVASFCELISSLHRRQVNVLTFVGPEEQDLMPSLQDSLGNEIPLVSENSVRRFVASIAQCDLFVSGDSGPMHLACAVGTRVVAIFLKGDFNRWGPPSSIARIIYRPGGCSPEDVLAACDLELFSGETPVLPPARFRP